MRPSSARTRSCLLGLVLALLWVAAPARAASFPETLNYQGRLRLTSGAAVADGPHSLAVALYTTPSTGTAIWSETLSGVQTKAGLFNVILGQSSPLTGLQWDQPYYLGLNADGDGEMAPRTPLAMAPYAFRAKYADVIAPLSLTQNAAPAGLFVSNLAANGLGAFIRATNTTATGLVVEGKAVGLSVTAFGGGGKAIKAMGNSTQALIEAFNDNGVGLRGSSPNQYGVLGETQGSGLGVVGVYGNATNDATGVWGLSGVNGAGVIGQGSTGVWGESVHAGGTGVYANQNGGAYALRVSGNAKFDGGVVDFSSTTVTGLSLPSGLSLPYANSANVSFPAAVFDISSNGSGYAIKGTATQAGCCNGPGTTVTAGVYGFTGVSLSAGVMGMSTWSSGTSGAGVYGIGPIGVKGDSQVSGGEGGEFKSDLGVGATMQGLTGAVATSMQANSPGLYAKNNSGFSGMALRVEGYSELFGSRNGTSVLRVENQSGAYSSSAIEAFSYASGTAAIHGVNYNASPLGMNSIPGVGVYGEGSIGVVGWSNATDGMGVIGHASGLSNSTGVRAENNGSGSALEADANNGTGIRTQGVNALQAYSYAPGGVGVYAYAGGSGTALVAEGNVRINYPLSGNTTTFYGNVDFSAANVTGLAGTGGVPNPLYLSGYQPSSAIITGNNSADGAGITGYGVKRGVDSYVNMSLTSGSAELYHGQLNSSAGFSPAYGSNLGIFSSGFNSSATGHYANVTSAQGEARALWANVSGTTLAYGVDIDLYGPSSSAALHGVGHYDAKGVVGQSDNSYGVYGQTYGNYQAGVYGLAGAGNNSDGVYGYSSSSGGVGVHGEVGGSGSFAGVQGATYNNSAYGVAAQNFGGGTGLYAYGSTAIYANGKVDMSYNSIINVGSPTSYYDAANKGYVDSLVGGGFSLPYSQSQSYTGDLFSLNNSGSGRAMYLSGGDTVFTASAGSYGSPTGVQAYASNYGSANARGVQVNVSGGSGAGGGSNTGVDSDSLTYDNSTTVRGGRFTGYNYAGTPGGSAQTYGVFAEAYQGQAQGAVYGLYANAYGAGNTYGVYSNGGTTGLFAIGGTTGVEGTASNNIAGAYGIKGTLTANGYDRAAVYGYNGYGSYDSVAVLGVGGQGVVGSTTNSYFNPANQRAGVLGFASGGSEDGVSGYNNGSGYGVRGKSSGGVGVYANGQYGIWAHGSSQGITATSDSGYAGIFQNKSSTLPAVQVYNLATTSVAMGLKAEVRGTNNGVAILGSNSSGAVPPAIGSGAGVYGHTDNSGSYGVVASGGTVGNGLFAEGTTVAVSATVNNGIGGSTFFGASISAKSSASATTAYGIHAYAKGLSKAIGIHGYAESTATTSYGVEGMGKSAGVRGEATAANGYGVLGDMSNLPGYGVYGKAQNVNGSAAVVGSLGTAVPGVTLPATGGYFGSSNSIGWGMVAELSNGTSNGVAAYVSAASATATGLYATNAPTLAAGIHSGSALNINGSTKITMATFNVPDVSIPGNLTVTANVPAANVRLNNNIAATVNYIFVSCNQATSNSVVLVSAGQAPSGTSMFSLGNAIVLNAGGGFYIPINNGTGFDLKNGDGFNFWIINQ